MIKTNAMRMLNAAKIPFESLEYTVDESDLSGVHIAEQIGYPLEQVFKTLVASGDKNGLNVFVIPVAEELDLKKCASVSGNKKVEMIAMKDLLAVTGYIRGGCSPVGMKKRFPTFFHTSAEAFESIFVSAGVRGLQLEISPLQLIGFVGGTVADVATF